MLSLWSKSTIARAGATPLVTFTPALPRSGNITDSGRCYYFHVTPGEGVTLRPQVAAGEIGARLPLNSKVALSAAVLAAYRSSQASAAPL